MAIPKYVYFWKPLLFLRKPCIIQFNLNLIYQLNQLTSKHESTESRTVWRLNLIKEERQCTYNIDLRRVRVSLLPWKRKKYYIFVCAFVRVCVRVPRRVGYAFECTRVALLIHNATPMRHILSSFVASLAPPYFSTSYKRQDFRRKKVEPNSVF